MVFPALFDRIDGDFKKVIIMEKKLMSNFNEKYDLILYSYSAKN